MTFDSEQKKSSQHSGELQKVNGNTDMDKLQEEIKILQENVRKRKQENASLKVLLYTGFALLLGGFIYSNTTLQRIQLQALEGNIQVYENQIHRDLANIQLNLLDRTEQMLDEKFALINRVIKKQNNQEQNTKLNVTLESLEASLGVIATLQPDTAEKIQAIKRDSKKLAEEIKQVQQSQTALSETIETEPYPE